MSRIIKVATYLNNTFYLLQDQAIEGVNERKATNVTRVTKNQVLHRKVNNRSVQLKNVTENRHSITNHRHIDTSRRHTVAKRHTNRHIVTRRHTKHRVMMRHDKKKNRVAIKLPRLQSRVWQQQQRTTEKHGVTKSRLQVKVTLQHRDAPIPRRDIRRRHHDPDRVPSPNIEVILHVDQYEDNPELEQVLPGSLEEERRPEQEQPLMTPLTMTDSSTSRTRKRPR